MFYPNSLLTTGWYFLSAGFTRALSGNYDYGDEEDSD